MIPSDNLLKSAIAWKELLRSEQTKEKAREIASKIGTADFFR